MAMVMAIVMCVLCLNVFSFHLPSALYCVLRLLLIPMSSAFADRDSADYTCHSWLPDDRSVVATRNGDILVFRKEELALVLSAPASQAGQAVVSLLPCARGFLVATEKVRVLNR
jgi:hypothetical protein